MLLLIYAAVVAAMTMSPTPLDRGYQGAISRFLAVLHRNGVPEWFGYSQLEFGANIAMFVPLGFFVGLLVPRRFFWLALAIVPATSTVIEVMQGLFLSQRFASVFDVVANTIGGWIGVAIVLVLRVFVEGRDRKIVARALWERNVAMMNAQRAAAAPHRDATGVRPDTPRAERR